MELKFAPEQASNFALEFDALFYSITALTVLFTFMVMVLCIYLIVKYRRGTLADRSNPMHHNTAVEVTWSVISLVLGMGIFGWGTKVYMEMRDIPEDAMEIFVIGKRWMWHVQHSNGVRENNELHIPVGVPVKITMISQDVVHGFYIPQFRVQFHTVPGRYTQLWFTATKEGRFNLFCSMHCGTQHSEMGGYVYAMDPKKWSQWMESGGNRFKERPQTMQAAGKDLYEQFACGNCHGTTDSVRAPSLAGIYGRKREFADGSSGIADIEYLRAAILRPEQRLVKGYLNSMQSYQGQLNEAQILKIIEYIKTLGTAPAPVTTPGPQTQANATTTPNEPGGIN